MAQKKFNLSRFFIINYLVAIGVLAVVISFIFSTIGRSNLISTSEKHSIAIALNLSSEIHQHFFITQSKTLETFDWRDLRQQQQMDEIARRFLKHLDVVKINIFDNDCQLVYSTNPELISVFTKDNLKLLRALKGEYVSSLELAREKSDIEHDVHPTDLLETYIPFRKLGADLTTEGEIMGSFEIYQDVTVLYQQILHFKKIVFAASFLIMGVLFVVLLIIVKKADRIRTKLEAEIERHTEHLEEMVQSRTQELHEEKNRLQVILDHVPSAFITLDKDFRIESASAALYNLTGHRFEEVRGKPCYEVFGKSEFCHVCPSRRAFSSGRMESDVKPSKGQMIIDRSSGRPLPNPAWGDNERFLEHVAVPIKRNGQIESILEIITDITERKRLQEQMIRTEKLSATGEMAAVIAHEMRNSLTSVKLILQFLAESHTASPPEKDSVEVAVDSIHQMESVVNELLNFARPAPPKLTIKNLNEVVRESIALSRHLIDRKRLRLVEDLSPEVPAMKLDADRLKEAFINLILNATQAVSERGKICISTHATRLSHSLSEYFSERKAPITLKNGQPVIRVEVTDNGCGIPKENLPRIFDPFFTTKIDGTGLGLAMARRVIHEHGGVITVESEIHKGTTFTFVLPYPARTIAHKS